MTLPVMLPVTRFAAVLLLALSACGGGYRPVSDWPVKVGAPYRVRGQTFVPAADPGYDVLGFAGWYGSESGSRTASGEKFRPRWITAAHPTLPLPTYLEVTALDTGRRVLVRVNDRGPFARGRVLDLSRGAAGLLGLRDRGVAPVRVRRVEPAEDARARLRRGAAAAAGPPVTGAALANLRAQLDAGVQAGIVQAP